MPDLFVAITVNRDLPRSLAHEAAEAIPERLRKAPCFLDRLTGIWRYDFGLPFDRFPSGGFVFGTHMYNPVESLFDVIVCAKKRLTQDQLDHYIERLTDPSKHVDALVEFVPALKLSPGALTEYEVAGRGEGQTTIDWLIRDETGTILLEIKNRTTDLVQQFLELEKGKQDPDGSVPAPVHDVRLLFRSLGNKFRSSAPQECLQGAWVLTQLKQERTELQDAFAELDRKRVHFAILGDWAADIFILTDDSWVRERLLAVFNANESDRFVFEREVG
jgi:Fe-S-cluster formation regulator IscX/YfhJ